MRLSKEFLITALPDALFYWGDIQLHAHSDAWEKLNRSVAVSIDTRTLESGDFFIPLKGPAFDAHDFIASALQKGAYGSLVAVSRWSEVAQLPLSVRAEKLFIVVSDTLEAFILLAKARRASLACPVVGITGSVGKTTTKEMVRTIVEHAGMRAYVSIKTYNNVYGICYGLLNMPDGVQVYIQEVGINAFGEMAPLADILRPTIGVITTLAHVHLEGLGNSLHGVFHEKRQLFSYFTPHDIGIVCGDIPLMRDAYYTHPIAKFGVKTKNQVQARLVKYQGDELGCCQTSFNLKWYGKKASVTLHGNNPGFVNNALAASAIAYFLSIPLDAVVQALESYDGFERRFEVRTLKQGKGKLVNDCYNAAPESMRAALLAFSQFKATGPKIVVLGDMLELGVREQYWHRHIGRLLAKVEDLVSVIVVGERARLIAQTAPHNLTVQFARDWREAQGKLEAELEPLNAERQALVLVKASKSMRLFDLVDAVVE